MLNYVQAITGIFGSNLRLAYIVGPFSLLSGIGGFAHFQAVAILEKVLLIYWTELDNLLVLRLLCWPSSAYSIRKTSNSVDKIASCQIAQFRKDGISSA